jgi:hypothetical protein
MNENDIEDANKYSYSISVVTNTGGAQEDVKKYSFRRQIQLLFNCIKYRRLGRYLLEQS